MTVAPPIDGLGIGQTVTGSVIETLSGECSETALQQE